MYAQSIVNVFSSRCDLEERRSAILDDAKCLLGEKSVQG